MTISLINLAFPSQASGCKQSAISSNNTALYQKYFSHLPRHITNTIRVKQSKKKAKAQEMRQY